EMARSSMRAVAGVPRRLKGETLPSDRPGAFSLTVREPVGVVAGITPFNVPLLKGAKQGAMALATGNCFVQLPSEHAPQIAHKLSRWPLQRHHRQSIRDRRLAHRASTGPLRHLLRLLSSRPARRRALRSPLQAN